MGEKSDRTEPFDIRLARRVRQECLKAAREGFQDASIQGLCSDGAVEAAISAIERLDLTQIVNQNKRQG